MVASVRRGRPGELVHVDVKKLGKIPDGGGWKLRGRGQGLHRTTRIGFDYLHVAIDDHSRMAFVRALPDEKGPTCGQFVADTVAFFAELGITVERVMTDNAMNYVRSRAFASALVQLGIRHHRIPPYRPRANGKVERFNRTMAEEWAYVRLYRSNSQRLRDLPRWIDYYNRRRPHTALGGQAPITRV